MAREECEEERAEDGGEDEYYDLGLFRKPGSEKAAAARPTRTECELSPPSSLSVSWFCRACIVELARDSKPLSSTGTGSKTGMGMRNGGGDIAAGGSIGSDLVPCYETKGFGGIAFFPVGRWVIVVVVVQLVSY